MEKQEMNSHASDFSNDKPIFIMDKTGKIIDVNEAFCEQLGLTKKEILGNILQDSDFLTHNSRKQAMYRQIARLIGK